MIDARSIARKMMQGACRCYPLISGCGKIANSRVGRRLSKGLGITETRLRGGGRIVVDGQDFVGRSIYYFGDMDPKLTRLCRKILRPGDTVVDIGANCGLVSVLVAGLVGSRGAVHAFEPQPSLVDLLERSAKINRYDHLHVHRVALSDRDGELSLTIPSDNSGAASFSCDYDDDSFESLVVPVKRSGAYLEQLGVGPIRLMKIDVEGHEAVVFAGASSLLESDARPEMIVFESNESVPIPERGTFKLLWEVGYKIYSMPRTWFRLRLEHVRQPDGEVEGSPHDFLAIDVARADELTIRRLGLTGSA